MGFSIFPTDKKTAAALANCGENVAATRAWLKETETEVLLEDSNRFFIDACALFPIEVRKPAVFEAKNLPEWARMDSATGMISGRVPEDASVFGGVAVEIAVTDCKGSLFQTNAKLVARNLAPIACATVQDCEFSEKSNVEMNLETMVDWGGAGADLQILCISGLPNGLYFDADKSFILGRPSGDTSSPMPSVVTLTTKATDGIIDQQQFHIKITTQKVDEGTNTPFSSVVENGEIVGSWVERITGSSESFSDGSTSVDQIYSAATELILRQKEVRDMAGADDRLDRITVEALLRQNILYLELQSQLDEIRDGKIVASSIVGVNGKPLPDWVTTIRDGLICATPPKYVSYIDIELNVEVTSGQKLMKPIRVNIQK